VNILMLAAEVAPYAKVGGLADVAGALPKALRQLGHDVRVVMPCYGSIDRAKWNLREEAQPFTTVVGHETLHVTTPESSMDGVPIAFLDVMGFFGNRPRIYGEPDDGRRFLFFCAAALELTARAGWKPDVVHANDWHTAIAPVLLATGRAGPFLRDTAALFTIHNLAYQGMLERGTLGGAEALLPDGVADSHVNIMELGLRSADVITTVSPTYANEIQTGDYGAGLDWLLRARHDRLHGVLNGIDTDVFNPATDPHIAAQYDLKDWSGKAVCKAALQQEAGLAIDPRAPVIGMVGRLVDQKGFDLFAAAVEPLLAHTPAQVVILGTGEPHYHALLDHLQHRFPGRLRAWLTFDAALAQRIYAGADMFLMPSRFEPCGLGQMIAMRYGTVPIVRGTGGLVDTVEEGPPGAPRTGFVFWEYDAGALQHALGRALSVFEYPDQWRQLIENDMSADFSWTRSAAIYAGLYQAAIDLKRG